MISRSFHQFQAQRAAPKLLQEAAKLQAQRDGMVIDNEKGIAEYYKIKSEIRRLEGDMHALIIEPINSLPFLQAGRLVHVKDGDIDWGWGIVAGFQKIKSADDTAGPLSAKQYVVDVLLRCEVAAAAPGSAAAKFNKPKPCPAGQEGEMQVVPIVLNLVLTDPPLLFTIVLFFFIVTMANGGWK
jgi:ATP-dependent RNA helicase DOB1